MSIFIKCLQGHDPRLIAMAVAICIIAAFASLGAYRRALTTLRRQRLTWVAITGVLLGAGVWATHYLLMLSYYPDAHASFGFDITALSLLAAVGGIGAGLALAAINPGRWSRPVGGLICGFAIYMVHLVNVFAMHLPVPATMRYDLTIASVLIGVLSPAAAFAIAGKLSQRKQWVGAAGLLVISVMGLHFLALSAVVLPVGIQQATFNHASSDPQVISIAVFSLLLFGAGLALLQVDRLSTLAAFSSVRAALDHAPSAFACFDRDEKLTFWNDRYAALVGQHGITPQRGMRVGQIRQMTNVAQLIEISKAPGGDVLPPNSFFAPDGRCLQRGMSSTDDGGLVIVLTDITEHLELIRSQNEARRLAEAASAAKSAFMANMSHEIRTPLNGILGMVQIIQMDGTDPVLQKHLAVISESGEALLEVLNNVLDLSKIEAGKLELDPHPFDLEDAIRQTVATYEPLALQKNIGIRTMVDQEARGTWSADSAKLRQVLANLLSNAIKFTAQGEIELRVEARRDGLTFAVKDSGIGIPIDKQDLIFDSFSQADASTTRRFGGTGLGLAICRQYVGLMGGKIVVASQENAGSTFSFTLPIKRIDAPAAGPKDAQTTFAWPGAAAVRILIAEDNPTNQLVLRGLLSPLNAELTVADNGSEAVAAFTKQSFDLVQMPLMDGLQATAALRAAERISGRDRTPIIALTASALRHQTDAYLAGGMDGFVPKPIRASELFAVLDQFLSATPRAEAPAGRSAA
jgi:signal transduction histidine kinase